MNNLKSYAKLTFQTSTGNQLIVNDVNDYILSVTTCKELSNPNGTFSIVLSPRIAKQLASERGTTVISDIIQPYDMVQIEFKVDEGGYKTEMIGLVSRASVELSIAQNGVPQRVIKIDGFDMGVVLKNFKLFFTPFVTGTNFKEWGGSIIFGSDNELFLNKNPAEFIQQFVILAVSTFGEKGVNQFSYPLTFNNGLKIDSYVDFVTGLSTSFSINRILDPFFLTNIQANTEVSVFDIIKFYSDPPYHEVFVDLRRPGKNLTVQQAEATHKLQPSNPVLPIGNNFGPNLSNFPNYQPYVFNMRTTPFSEGTNGWDGLNAHYFLSTDVINQSVAFSEQNVYNYFDVLCERQSFTLGELQLAYVSEDGKSTDSLGNVISRFPIQDQSSIDRFGIKRFPYHTTKYVEFVNSSNTLFGPSGRAETNFLPLKQIRTLARQLFRWFSFGELFETGIISLKGRVGVGKNGITMGSRLVEVSPNGKPTGKQYYIESVLQEFSLGSPLKTTVSVTRGHFPHDWVGNSPNSRGKGRFTLVREKEIELNLEQTRNSEFFVPVDFRDGVL